MDGVSVASGIAGLVTLCLQITDTVYAYVTAIKDRSKNINEFHKELLLLGEVLSHLRDFLDQQQAKGQGFGDDSVLQKAITECHARIERIGDRLRPRDGGKLAKLIDRMKWPFEQSEVVQLMENLRRFRSTFEFAANIQGYRILAKTSDDASEGLKQLLDLSKKTEEMYARSGLVMEAVAEESKRLEAVLYLLPVLAVSAHEIREVSHAMRLAEMREQEERTTRILEWLAPIEVLHKHRDIQSRRSPGTGRWFSEGAQFQRWANSEKTHDLVCVGNPGVGKSVLMSHVVDVLKERQKDNETLVLYYYCDYSEQQEQSPSQMARSLLRQSCTAMSTVPVSVAEFYSKTRNEIKDQTWFYELLDLLRRCIATFSRCYILIDALDETEPIKQRTGLLDTVKSIRSGAGDARVLITTRPHTVNVEEKLLNPVRINITAATDDLKRYIAATIDSHPDAGDIIDLELKNEIVDRLCATADGMFLLPSLHVRSILDQPTKGDVRETLETLPPNLNEAFHSTLERIENLPVSRKSVAFRSLLWISHAARPLRIDELQQALAIREDAKEIDEDYILPTRTILDACCGLVVLEPDSGIVRLIHHSLEEYLQSQDHNLFEDAHLVMLKACLGYMSMESLKPLAFKNRTDFEGSLRHHALLDYSCLQWGVHASAVPVESYSDVALPLLRNSQALLVIARVRDAKTPDFRRWRERMWTWAYEPHAGAAISLACSFGLTDLVRLLISWEETPNLKARNMYGSTPLHEVAILGFDDTAEVLVAHGADVLDQNKGKATPFYLAISYGRLSMAQLLFKYNRAQIDTHCKSGYTALHKAVELGSDQLVEWLLGAGSLVNARTDRGLTTIHIAAMHGYVTIARMLVLRGADLNVLADDRQTPLEFAATAGHADMVDYLIKQGADISRRAKDGWTPLHRAARGGHVDTVVLLLEQGAEVINRDTKGNLPLHHAARAGHLETIIQLLEYDMTVKRKQLFYRDRKGDTPRIVAFYCAHHDVHKYLRTQEWEVLGEEPTSASKTTLAIESGGIEDVIRLVSDDTSLIELVDEDGQPPLHVAIQEDQMAILKMLLGKGADIESVGFHGWRPLHIAASTGNLEMVNLLLAHGAHIQSRTVTQQTPLHKAASSHSVLTLQRLLEAGADITAVNDRKMNVLHIAAHQNDLEMVRYLVLEQRMDLFTRDKFGQTPSLWAERAAHLEMLNFLKSEERKVKRARGERVSMDRSESWEEDILPFSRSPTLTNDDKADQSIEKEKRGTDVS